MSLPERQDRHVIEPFDVRPANPPAVYRPQPIQPVPERRIVGYERYAEGLLPVYEVVAPVERTPERDLTPQPLIDPIAQRLGCGALLAVGVGIGGWLLFTPWAALCLGALAVIVVASKLPGARRGTTTINVTNNNRWWGRSSSPIK